VTRNGTTTKKLNRKSKENEKKSQEVRTDIHLMFMGFERAAGLEGKEERNTLPNRFRRAKGEHEKGTTKECHREEELLEERLTGPA